MLVYVEVFIFLSPSCILADRCVGRNLLQWLCHMVTTTDTLTPNDVASEVS